MQQAVLVGRRAEHADLDFGDVTVGRRAHGVDQVERRIAEGRSRASVAPDHDDGNRAVLDHEAEHGGGVAHGVGAVADDDAVDAGLDLVADGLGQGGVLLPAHVLGEDAEDLSVVRLQMSASSGTAP